MTPLSPDDDAAMVHAIAEEDAAQAENSARCRQLEVLLNEDSLLGALRRAIDAVELDYPELAAKAEVPSERLRDFFWGDAHLSGAEVDRLAAALGLKLVPMDVSC